MESPNRSKLEGGGEKSEQNVQVGSGEEIGGESEVRGAPDLLGPDHQPDHQAQVLEFQELPLTEDESEEESGTVLGGIMEKKKNTEEGRGDRRIQMKKDIDSKQTQEEPSLLAILRFYHFTFVSMMSLMFREYRLASRGRDLQAEKPLFLLFSAVLYQCLLS